MFSQVSIRINFFVFSFLQLECERKQDVFSFVFLFIFFGILFPLSSLVFCSSFGVLFILVWCFSGTLDILCHYCFKCLLCPILSFISCSSNNKYVLSLYCHRVVGMFSSYHFISLFILSPFQLGSYFWLNLSHMILSQ